MLPASLDNPDFATLLERLSEQSDDLEQSNAWPEESWKLLAEAGVLNWFIPAEFGGNPVDDVTRQLGYLELASACLTTTFILTQHNAAISRILLSENEQLKRTLLDQLASGAAVATVGISHLTTSRQHLKEPAVKVDEGDDGLIMSGEIPWVTSAPRADIIVTGGVQSDGLQVLVALDTSEAGLKPQSAPSLLALNESQTASVTLEELHVSRDRLLLGPEPEVLKAGGAGGVTTSALALGAAQKSIRGIETEAERREDLRASAGSLRETLTSLKQELTDLLTADGSPAKEALESLRLRSNSLALRSAQAYLTASKGAGFLQNHPASRAIREAQFFLVWSCPQPVMAAALEEFSCAVF